MFKTIILRVKSIGRQSNSSAHPTQVVTAPENNPQSPKKLLNHDSGFISPPLSILQAPPPNANQLKLKFKLKVKSVVSKLFKSKKVKKQEEPYETEPLLGEIDEHSVQAFVTAPPVILVNNIDVSDENEEPVTDDLVVKSMADEPILPAWSKPPMLKKTTLMSTIEEAEEEEDDTEMTVMHSLRRAPVVENLNESAALVGFKAEDVSPCDSGVLSPNLSHRSEDGDKASLYLKPEPASEGIVTPTEITATIVTEDSHTKSDTFDHLPQEKVRGTNVVNPWYFEPEEDDDPLVIRHPGPLPPHLAESRDTEFYITKSPEIEKEIRRNILCGVLRGAFDFPPHFVQTYKIRDILGEGAFGCVYSALVLEGPHVGKEAAVKIMIRERLPKSGWAKDQLYGYIPMEAHFMRKANHPNIVQFYDYYHTDEFVIIVTEHFGTEWCMDNPKLNPIQNTFLVTEGGRTRPTYDLDADLSSLSDDELMQRRRAPCDLFECIEAHKQRLDLNPCQIIFAQTVHAVHYIHSLGFVHRDIKDENVLVDEKYNVKLIDFGSLLPIPTKEEDFFRNFNGTLTYASPEIAYGMAVRGPEAEVWALGVLLFTIIYGYNPFNDIEDIKSGRNPVSSDYRSTFFGWLLMRMLDNNPQNRITIQEINEIEAVHYPELLNANMG